MVAEPPQNEGESHPSKDDVSNNHHLLPQRRAGSNLARAPVDEEEHHHHHNHHHHHHHHPPPSPPPPSYSRGSFVVGGRNISDNSSHNSSSHRRTSPPYNGLRPRSPSSTTLSPSSLSSPSPSPSSSASSSSTTSSPSSSASAATTTASSVCDSTSMDKAPTAAAAAAAGGRTGQQQKQKQQQEQEHQTLSTTSSSSSMSSSEKDPRHHNRHHHRRHHPHHNSNNSNLHHPSSREQQVPLEHPCIRNQQQQQQQQQQQHGSPSSEQMTEACPQLLRPHEEEEEKEKEKETGAMSSSSSPHAKIIVTPDDDGDDYCSIAGGDDVDGGVREDSGGVGRRRRRRSGSSANKPAEGVGGGSGELLEAEVKGPSNASDGARRNSCGSVNSSKSNSNSSKHSIGNMCEGQVWVRGGTMPDLSEFERVWEAAPEVIIKPATLASSETLTPTEALTPTPTHTLDSLTEARSVASDPSAFHDPQEVPLKQEEEEEGEEQYQDSNSGGSSSAEWPSRSADDLLLVGAVGGGGHACGCGIEMGVLDGSCGRCPTCPPPAEVYVSEQFPSSDPLECGDGSTHTLHVDLTTGEVQLHMHHVSDPEKGPLPQHPHHPHPHAPVPGDPNTKCLHDPCSQPPPTTSQDHPDGEPTKKAITFSSGIGEASVYHALVVIFLEFFAWGLLTAPMITVLNDTFPDHTFLMNGLIVGIKGILSFLSAPLIGALSDLWGRKFFLFITVFFTCLPIPFMKINTWWYFALISMSGVFAVTFSIVFAYVADVTDESERSSAYGLVSATFAASLVTSPALGAYLGRVHSDDLVVGLATAIAILDVFFILVAVPESLPEKLRLSSSWSAHISWEQADPFSALWKVSKDRNVLLISVSVFLSYLPEAGQYSCFFVYLRLVMDFTAEMVATFIAVVGILSVVAQTALLSLLMKKLSNKHVIIVGLVFEMLQLMWYGFGSKMWMMWAAGLLASVSSITYPAISAYVSTHTDVDKQGVVQGIITGMRGLCSGLGPAVFGFIFYLFHVDLNTDHADDGLHKPNGSSIGNSTTPHIISSPNLVPGPPFVFGALLVICALMVAAFIPEGQDRSSSKNRKQSGGSLDLSYERGHKKNDSLDAASLPLMDETDVL